MTQVELRLKEKGLELPECPIPVAAYVVAQCAGDLIFVAGQTAYVDGILRFPGKVGVDVTPEEAYQSAQIAALRCISELHSVANLDRVKIIKVNGYVNTNSDCKKQPAIINGASELLEYAFCERGKHARTAIGVESLPDCASVEIELIAQRLD